MPRSKNVKPDQARKALAAGVQRIVEALRSRSGKKRLKEHADDVAMYWHQLQWLLNVLSQKPRPTKEQLDVLFQGVLSGDTGQSISLANLRVFEDMLTNTVVGLSGQNTPGPLTPKALGRFLLRASSPVAKPRELKPEFIAAYKARENARGEGREITIKALAQQFTRSDYERNPESALSGMSRGLNRVRARIETQSKPSPPDSEMNVKTKHKNVHKR